MHWLRNGGMDGNGVGCDIIRNLEKLSEDFNIFDTSAVYATAFKCNMSKPP